MYETKQYFYGTGRRKHSVARVRVYNGTGKITINNRDIDDYFGLETLKLMVRQPAGSDQAPMASSTSSINVVGGGTCRPGWRYPPRPVPRSAAVRPRAAQHPEEGWLPDPRSSYEGT